MEDYGFIAGLILFFRIMLCSFCPSTFWFPDSYLKTPPLINLKFDRVEEHHLGKVASKISASRCIHLSVCLFINIKGI